MRLVCCALLCAASLLAAGIDGQRGPFNVLTYSTPGSLPGVPSGSGVPYTVILITCPDAFITGVRVTVTYRNASGTHQESLTTAITEGRGGVSTPIPRREITSLQLTELRDGASY